MAIIKIKGMSCQHCVASVTTALNQIPGISNVRVNLERGEAEFDGEVAAADVQKAIVTIGFEVIS